MRYELKILFPVFEKDTILRNLFSNSLMIREIYHERQINNIYFDSLGYSDYLANLHGDALRKKYRIRWYGELHQKALEPTLELKYKQGLVGGKKFVKLPDFSFNSDFSHCDYFALLRKTFSEYSDEQQHMLGELLSRNPVLVNTYKRRYFLTANEKYRLTIDIDMNYSHFDNAKILTPQRFGCAEPNVVLEIKFESENVDGATKLINELGYRIYKNSKYVNGINNVLYGMQPVAQ